MPQKTYTPEELKHILEKHCDWLINQNNGAQADLGEANLCGANLRGADLRGADLCGANLRGANLRGADLCEADLCGANLRGADLRGANLRGADLCGANLRGADLREANLRGADLRGADLRGADLCEANLRGANLCEANLRGADLRGADLCGANLPNFQIVPETGAFVAYKKLRGKDNKPVVAMLEIPAEAKRTSSLVGRKCRAEFVRVLSGNGKSPTSENPIEYLEGKVVRADSYDDDVRVECSNGIHFFITRREAEEWSI